MSRRKLSPSARRDHLRQLAEGTCSAGAMLVLLVLFDRTGHGAHASWCGRAHLGEEVARMVGRSRPYSVRTVCRWLAELRDAGHLGDTTKRYNLPALRRLSDKLLDRLDGLAGIRRRRRATAGPAEPVATCPECGVSELWGHAEGCGQRGPPAGEAPTT